MKPNIHCTDKSSHLTMSNGHNYAIALCLALALSACGGGGGGGSSSGASTTPVFVASNIITSAPTGMTYAGGSEELQAFNLLNAERAACGYGYLSQSTALDNSVINHATWLGVNNYAMSHNEEAVFSSGPNVGTNTTGFTGVNPVDRMVAAGYNQTDADKVQEVGASKQPSTTKTGYGSTAVRNLLAAPYHANAMIGPFRNLGVTIKSSAVAGLGADITAPAGSASRVFFFANLGYLQGTVAQQIGSTDVLTYPCQGTTGTAYQLTAETPNPVPGRNLATNPLGQSVFVSIFQFRYEPNTV